MTNPEQLKRPVADLLDEQGFTKEAALMRRLGQMQENMLENASGGSRRAYIFRPLDGTLSRLAFDWLVEAGLLAPNRRKGKEHTFVAADSRFAKND